MGSALLDVSDNPSSFASTFNTRYPDTPYTNDETTKSALLYLTVKLINNADYNVMIYDILVQTTC